jgi:hypothetical protein
MWMGNGGGLTASRRSRRCASINTFSKRIATVTYSSRLNHYGHHRNDKRQFLDIEFRTCSTLIVGSRYSYSPCRQILRKSTPTMQDPNKVREILCLELLQPLNLEVLQVFRRLSCSSTNRGYLGLWSLLYLSLGLLRGGILWQLLCERDELRGSWEILSKWFRNIESL